MLRKLLTLPIHFYQLAISPLLGANKCRYQPTCSHYAIEAIETWGPVKGSWLAAKRIGSCHPWGGHGFDPVPKKPVAEDVDAGQTLS
ncbi:membrane protein insertion efficiency factor YidD [Neolewinella antarctica]|uniref:Putative membrane protein insertion efficiency factor n=1 Tax=Neolewinella antarctica TaxID=442734 RepID=A0ABX0XF99_9BACT|nr:membrane protein insertion efficiency factor YidD [Neolewinella antarctica]NJC27554.1 hypothetical protein [Neolewinella antarctica]